MAQAQMEHINNVPEDQYVDYVMLVAEPTEDYHSQQTHHKVTQMCPYGSQ